MEQESSAQSASTWPLVKFSFQVKMGNAEMIFQEVTGLSAEAQVIEYRGGNSKEYSTVKMPSIQKFGNVTLKKGVLKGDKNQLEILNNLKLNTLKRETVFISLLDETGASTMAWSLLNAFPCKVTLTDMKADGNEAAIEMLELAHEGLKII